MIHMHYKNPYVMHIKGVKPNHVIHSNDYNVTVHCMRTQDSWKMIKVW